LVHDLLFLFILIRHLAENFVFNKYSYFYILDNKKTALGWVVNPIECHLCGWGG